QRRRHAAAVDGLGDDQRGRRLDAARAEPAAGLAGGDQSRGLGGRADLLTPPRRRWTAPDLPAVGAAPQPRHAHSRQHRPRPTPALIFPAGAWDVNPSNPMRLYAVDLVRNSMMFSTDGGASWNPDPEITSLVTRGGTYRFISNTYQALIRGVAFDPNSSAIV